MPSTLPILSTSPPAPVTSLVVDAALTVDPILEAEVFEPSAVSKAWRAVTGGLENLFGLASVIVGLAVLATIPIAQFLSLGYLLEASGRVAARGRLRDGFIGLKGAAHLGGLVVGTRLMMLPMRFVSDLWYSAQLIEPEGSIAANWRVGLWVTTVVMIAHILCAWYAGGRLRHFFWPLLAPVLFAMWILRRMIASRTLRPIVQPIVGTLSKSLLAEITYVPPLSAWFPPAILCSGMRRGGLYSEARDAVWAFFSQIQFTYYFWLGLRGFAGALIWLAIPNLLLLSALRIQPGLGFVSGTLGAILLGWVLLYLPFLQTHFAVRKQWAALFEIGQVRARFRHAPIAFWLALLVTLLFAVPLYLLKIEATPRELAWLPSLVFVAFIYPARLLSGWAVGRAYQRETPRLWVFRWGARFAAVPVVAGYVLIVFFSQFTSWYGALSLFEQHAFLVPVPFLGL